jgi:hypothetical protein
MPDATARQPLDIEFQWSTLSTQPSFRDSMTGEILTNSASADTLRYQGNTYTLQKIQITRAAHGSWLIPLSGQADNRHDIVFTFTVNDTPQTPKQPKQIIIVVPILQSLLDTTDPNFLKKLVIPQNADLPNFDPAATVSLGEFFPPASSQTVTTYTLHAHYTICAAGANPGDPPQDILVIVQTAGLRISEVLMALVELQLNNVGSLDVFGAYVPLAGTTFVISNTSAFSNAEFQRYVKYAYNLGERRTAAPPPTPLPASKEEAVDAYQCVPFDPETQLEDGKIKFDTATGTPYSRIQTAREKVKSEAQQTNATIESAEKFIKGASKALSAIIGLTVVGILIYILMNQGGGLSTPEQAQSGIARAAVRIAAVPTYLILAVLFGIIGFIVGFAIKAS